MDAPLSPLAVQIETWVRDQYYAGKNYPVLFVSGAQGVGKSTALRSLRISDVEVLSIDDFYLPAAERARLAREVHPLCATRGPAGTHDVALLLQVIDQLVDESPGRAPVAVPMFDKARDDRSGWRHVDSLADIVVVEGWLMGALPDPAAPGDPPLNAVEEQDPEGIWRAWQELKLAETYAPLWARAKAFLHVDAPSFEIVRDWRIQQEETTLGLAPGTLPPERVAWVERFIQHYERVTRRMLNGHRRDGVAIAVDENRVPSPF